MFFIFTSKDSIQIVHVWRRYEGHGLDPTLINSESAKQHLGARVKLLYTILTNKISHTSIYITHIQRPHVYFFKTLFKAEAIFTPDISSNKKTFTVICPLPPPPGAIKAVSGTNMCPQTPHSGYITLCYFNHCQHKNHMTMLYHVIDSNLQLLFTNRNNSAISVTFGK